MLCFSSLHSKGASGQTKNIPDTGDLRHINSTKGDAGEGEAAE